MERGCIFSGQGISVKASLSADPSKTVLVEVKPEDTIGRLMRNIGYQMGEKYDIYKNLTELKATQLCKKSDRRRIDQMERVAAEIL